MADRAEATQAPAAGVSCEHAEGLVVHAASYAWRSETTGQVIGFSAEVSFACKTCGQPFQVIGDFRSGRKAMPPPVPSGTWTLGANDELGVILWPNDRTVHASGVFLPGPAGLS